MTKAKVTISQQAFLAILLHAKSYRTTAIHGLLVGSLSENNIVVSHAFPICHETPTKPLVDSALAMVESELSGDKLNTIVGWFTSPEILGDNKAGPVAMRIAANLALEEIDPVLLVLQSDILGKMTSGDDIVASQCLRLYGKDFGKQWMELLEVDVMDDLSTKERAIELLEKGLEINDLSEHWEKGSMFEWNHSGNMFT